MSCDTLRTIKLTGVLGKRFGRVHKLDVDTPAEAIRALCVIKDGFREFLQNSEQNGIRYKFVVGDIEVNKDELKSELHMVHGESKTFTLAPVMRGAKSAWAQVLIGATLILASFFVPIAAGFLLQAGISMALGGVAQLLSPTPKAENKEAVENRPSYVFNGAVNTVAQGNPVPILYGRMMVGSQVISAGITNKDIPV